MILSKASTIILGMIVEKSINPYEIIKLLEFINIKNWYSVAASSVYATITSLLKKGLIVGKNIKDGNMPEKTVYSITEAGNVQLTETLEYYLGSVDFDPVQFNIAVILICHLPKERALSILNDRVSRLQEKIGIQKSNLEKLRSIEPLGLHAIKHVLHHTKADLESVTELIETINNDSLWNHFLANDYKGDARL